MKPITVCAMLLVMCPAVAAANDGRFVHTMRSEHCIIDRKDEKFGGVVAVIAGTLAQTVVSYAIDTAVDALDPKRQATTLTAEDFEVYLFKPIALGEDRYSLRFNNTFGCFTTILDSFELPGEIPSILDVENSEQELSAANSPREKLIAAGFSWLGSDEDRMPSIIFEARIVSSEDETALYGQATYYLQDRWFEDLPIIRDGKLSISNEYFGTQALAITYSLYGAASKPYLSLAFDFGKVNVDEDSFVTLNGVRQYSFDARDLKDMPGMRTAWVPIVAPSAAVAEKFAADVADSVSDLEDRNYMPASVFTSVQIEPEQNKTLKVLSTALERSKPAILEAVKKATDVETDAAAQKKIIAENETKIKQLRAALDILRAQGDVNADQVSATEEAIAAAELALANATTRLYSIE